MPRQPPKHGATQATTPRLASTAPAPLNAPHADKATAYARGVVAGEILAGLYVREACQRFLDDLKRDGDAFPYEFDRGKAESACRFIELLPHTKGKWARADPSDAASNCITLEPWQCFIVANIFGWVHTATRLRRFREAYIEVPRKNGKSILAAGIGLYMFAVDAEPGAEIYSGATTEKQAWEVFRPARLMTLARPKFKAQFGILVNASNICIPTNGSRFEPLIGKPGDGASPSCAIIDEYHEHDSPEQYDTMLTGMGAREAPLMFIITTAGDNLAGPCYDKRITLTHILDGIIADDEKFGIIYTIDKGDDWTQTDVLRKANPNFGISVDGDFLASRQREAMQNSRRQGVFLTKHLNVWVNSRAAYFNMQKYGECEEVGLTLDMLVGRRCYVALDLATKVDIADMCLLFPLDDGRYAVFWRHYLPERTVENTKNDHYRGWAIDGRLQLTDGDIIDFDRLKDDILDLSGRFEIAEVAYDPFQATHLATQLMAEGVPVVEYRQTVQTMSDPMKTVDALIIAHRLSHDGDPVANWMMSNVVARTDAKDNVYPVKERPENKIDAPVALIMAMGRAMATDDAMIYGEGRGLVILE